MFWGLISQMHVLKVEVPNVRFKHFTPQGEAPDFEFPPVVGNCGGGGVYDEIVSQLL